MSTQKLLLPYNFSEHDHRALEFAINTFASRDDVEITLFHAYPVLPAIDVQDKDVTERLKGSMSYLYSKISELESEFHTVRNELVQGGFKEERVKELFRPRKRDVATEIMEVIGAGKFNCVVLSRRAGKIGRFFTGSVHLKLISTLKRVTVCIVT